MKGVRCMVTFLPLDFEFSRQKPNGARTPPQPQARPEFIQNSFDRQGIDWRAR
jgi:hypothetical protein